ncbi:MAG: hypothetical protein JSS60_02250 [Verrucomicrobia bacterium]|nr:hypothetical protein [Verrucomicrobiota bacterium]
MHAAPFWKTPCTLALCLASSFTNADELSSRLSALETRMAAIKTETVKKTTGVQLASANPQYDGYGLFTTAELLFWHLYQGGSDYSLSHNGPINQGQPVKGESKHSHFDWDFGFRAGAGYNFEHDGWDAYINFTWFQTDASNSAHAPKNGGLVPLKGDPFTLSAKKINSHWDVHYYVLDLELGRSFFVSKFLSFRPQFGIESAWICQRRRYETRQPPDPATSLSGQNIYGKNNFWGIGPRAGLEGSWYLGKHFSLLGSVNGSLQWGHFDAHTKETDYLSTGKLPIFHIDGDFHRLVPNVQMKLEIGWDANINNDENHLGVMLGYEFQYWWRQNQFINEPFQGFTFQHESMDLSINGLTLAARFDF